MGAGTGRVARHTHLQYTTGAHHDTMVVVYINKSTSSTSVHASANKCDHTLVVKASTHRAVAVRHVLTAFPPQHPSPVTSRLPLPHPCKPQQPAGL
jgi:hypothetical protein